MAQGRKVGRVGIISFPGSSSLIHHIAEDKGFNESFGVEVVVTPTPNSVYQITNFVSGTFEIASTAIDNIVAYQEGQGAVALDREPDMFVFLGGAKIDLALTVAPGIDGYGGLKGKTIAVDALSTGFAFVLRDMLERGGLGPDDYTLVSVGGTDKRWDALKAGEHVATLLNDPFTGFALDAGFKVLESSLDTLPHYQAGIFAARRSWAADNRDLLITYIRAHLAALDWLLDPANEAEATAILRKHVPHLSEKGAAMAVSRLIAPRSGFPPKGAIDREGVKTVLDLRSRYGEPKTRLDDPDKYIDLSYYEAALKAR